LKRHLPALLLAGVVAVAALVPLYGDIRPSSLSHPEWGRMMLRAIHKTEIVETAQASQVFSLLSWRDSLTFRADRYYRADKVEVRSDGNTTCVTGQGGRGEVAYRVGIVRAGRYRVRVQAKGAAPLLAQLAKLEDGTPLASYDLTPAAFIGWVEGRAQPGAPSRLEPGGYVASVLVPPETCLTQVEIVPPCLNPIEPIGGWKPRAVTQASDVAVTIVKALDLESELPPAAVAVERSGSDFEVEEITGRPLAIPVSTGPELTWLRAGSAGSSAFLMLNVPEDGLYNISVLGRYKGAQRWGLDSCFETVLCPSNDAEGLRWRSIATLALGSGRHYFSVDLAPESIVAKVKIEQKKRTPEDYMETLKRLGFDVGVEGPVSRRVANDALGFLKGRIGMRDQNMCLDVERQLPDPNVQIAGGPGTQLQQAPAPPNRSIPETGQGLPPLQPPGTGPGPSGSTPQPPTPQPPTGGTPPPPTVPPPTPTATVPATATPPLPTPLPTLTPTTPPPPSPTDTPIPLPTPTPVCTTPPCPI
jgi:hypothetical protein